MTFTGIRFIGNGSRAEAAFPRGMGMGVRRTKLHEILVREAAAAGVRMMWGTTVSQTPDRVMVAGGAVVRSRWVVGADGQKSRVREWAGIRSRSREKARYGFRGHFSIRPWTDLVEVYWGSACQVIITPVNPGEICVALMTQDAGRGFAAALSQFPALQMRLKGAAPSSALRGALSIQRTLRAVVKDRYVLVGDASGSVDAITGEGLSLSFQEAECLAEALACDDLSLYQKGHRRIRRVASMMAQMMLLMDASPPLGKAVLRFFASCPRVFQVFLATHLGMSASEIES